MESAHIVKSFDEELAQIESLLLEMGGLVEAQIADSIEALLTGDTDLTEKIKRDDKKIDALEMRTDELAIKVLALRQPMATDLRVIVCALRVSSNLERIGDYAKNIAKRGRIIGGNIGYGSSANTLKRMGRMVRAMVSDSLDAFVNKDLAMANEVRARDEEVDHMHNAMFRELLTHMMEDPRSITPCMHLLFIAKNLERMGDHVTAVCEQIIYLVEGKLPDDDRPKGDMLDEIADKSA